MNEQDIKLLAAIGTVIGGFYVVVTRPLLRLIESESARTRAEVKADIQTLRADMAELKSELRTEMTNMELRLNDRIDTRLARR